MGNWDNGSEQLNINFSERRSRENKLFRYAIFFNTQKSKTQIWDQHQMKIQLVNRDLMESEIKQKIIIKTYNKWWKWMCCAKDEIKQALARDEIYVF